MKQGALALCGFMGCGKTTVGMAAAKLLSREFLDLDDYIEAKQGMTISEIFAERGEEAFRQMETEALKETAARRDVVIALGGGTVLRSVNVEALKSAGALVVLLDASLPVLQQRLKNDTQRPLLQRPDRKAFIEELLGKRLPLYRAAADAVIDGSGPPEEVTAELVSLVK